MQRTSWLRTFGYGCGFLAAILVIIGVVVGWRLSVTFGPIREAVKFHEELADKHGEGIRYVPPPDGAILAERLERFIAIRESLREPQAELGVVFADFPPEALIHDDTSSLFAKASSLVGTLDTLIQGIGRYAARRHRALAENGMGVGEYVYIYSVVYYSWLGHPVVEPPVITKAIDRTESGWRTGDSVFKDDHDTYSPERLRTRYRWYATSMLENQLGSLPADTDEAWRATLVAEIERLREDPHAVAWDQGLPEALRTSLESYRERLEALYSPTSNCFELPPEDEEPAEISRVAGIGTDPEPRD